MSLLELLRALFALPLVFYLPGWLFCRFALPHLDPLTSGYVRVVASTLLSGWLALLLASLGIFSLWLQLLIIVLICGGLWLLARRTPALPPPPEAMLRRVQWYEVAAFAGIGALAFGLVLPPFETVLGARDAGVYASTGLAIARTGSLVQHDPLLAALGQQTQSADPVLRGAAEQARSNFLGVQNPERFIATRLYTAGFFINEGELVQGRIVPQHLHLLSAWIGLLASICGVYGGLAAPGVLGVLGAWSVGMLGRQLMGVWGGWVAFLLLALNTVQVWFSRYSTAETTAQFLIFAGLYAFAALHSNPPLPVRARLAYAGIAGIAFGQLALNRIDAFLVLAPVVAYLGYCWLTRRWQGPQTVMSLALAAMLIHAALHIILIARAYFFDTAFARLQDFAITSYIAQPFITPLLREVYHTTNRSPFKDPLQIWRELVLLSVGLALVLALWRWQTPVRWIEQQLLRWQDWLRGGIALLILLLAGYAYLVRPQILTPALLADLPVCLLPQNWQGQAGLAPEADACLILQGYVGAPVAIPEPPPGGDPRRMVPLANLVRIGWYLSPLGVVLGVVGFALWWWRGLHRASWLFLVVGLLGTFFFVRDTYGTTDQTYIYILRRFVPIAYPAFTLSIAYALVQLAGASPLAQGWYGRVRRVSAASAALLLVAFFAWTGRPVYRHIEYHGAVATLAATAAQIAPDTVLLVRGGAPTASQSRDVPDLVATPLRFGFGVNALPVKSSNPGTYAEPLAQQVAYWQAQGREVQLLLSASGADLVLPGMRLTRLDDLTLRVPEFEQLTNQKPRNVALLSLDFTRYLVEPDQAGSLPTLPLPITARDFAAQVRGFYLPEVAADGTVYAWTDGDALLRVAWRAGDPAAVLHLTLAGGNRPAQLGAAEVCVAATPETAAWSPATHDSLSFTPLGCFTLAETWKEYAIVLDPAQLPPAATGSLLLRLTSDGWVPAQADPRQNDQRGLGIQFGGLRPDQASLAPALPARR